MKFCLKDIKRIDIFAPGTAGEKAVRIETIDGRVEIIDEFSTQIIQIENYEKISPGYAVMPARFLQKSAEERYGQELDGPNF